MTIEYQLIFRCACGEHRVYADYDCPVSDAMAREDLLKLGWRHAGEFEYVCPQCQREMEKPQMNKMTTMLNDDSMTPESRGKWLSEQAAVIGEKFKQKYLNGQAEHKGDLGAVPVINLLNEMEAEALDQLSYIRELKRRLIT